MNGRLRAKFAPAFSRDLKRKAGKRGWNLDELEAVIDLILENSAESMEVLRRRHNMHRLSGRWGGSNECHVANAGDWPRRRSHALNPSITETLSACSVCWGQFVADL